MAGERPAEVLRAHFATFGDGGLDEAVELWDQQIEWRAIEGAADDVGVIRGIDAMRAYYADWVDAMDDLRCEVAEIVYEDDERVAALLRNSGRGRVSGVSAAGRYYVACLVRDGRIVTGREFSTSSEAVSAARELR